MWVSVFFNPRSWCLIIGRPGKLRACGIGRKRFRKPVSLYDLGGISGQGNMDSGSKGFESLGCFGKVSCLCWGCPRAGFHYRNRDVALGCSAFPRLVKCHSLIPSFSRDLWNTCDAELGKMGVKGRQHPRRCPRRWKGQCLWPCIGRIVLLRSVTEILIRLRTFGSVSHIFHF